MRRLRARPRLRRGRDRSSPPLAADASEVETQGRRAELLEGPRQRMDDFVLQRAAVQRMRMADDAEMAGVVLLGDLEERLERACGSRI